MVNVRLSTIFPAETRKGVDKYVQNFDFANGLNGGYGRQRPQYSQEDCLHLDLAPDYGRLNSESFRAMDEELKIMFAGTMRQLENIPPRERNWKKVLETMNQCPVLELASDGRVDRADVLMKTGKEHWQFNGSSNSAIVREVYGWFTRLVSDGDVIQSTKFDLHTMAKVVAQTAVAINTLTDFMYSAYDQERTIVDIGILRFPDPFTPYFKVYHIKLTAWTKVRGNVVWQGYQNGIRGEYYARNFRPRASVIDRLTLTTKAKALEEAEGLFA